MEKSLTVPRTWNRCDAAILFPEKLKHMSIKTCTFVFIFSLFVKAKKQNELSCLPTDEWKNKVKYIHKMKFYSSVARNKLDIWCNIDKPQRYYAKRKNLDATDHILNNFIYMKCTEKGKSIETERLEVVWKEWLLIITVNGISDLTWVIKCSKTAIW